MPETHRTKNSSPGERPKGTAAQRQAAVEARKERVARVTQLRPGWLHCVRESDQYSEALFDGMRQQTLAPHRHDEYVAAIYATGMAPWRSAETGSPLRVTLTTEYGDPVSFDVPVVRLPGRYKTLLFRFGDAMHLWCMGSAAMLGRNDSAGLFNRQLAEVIKAYWPHNLVSANITRLLRSEKLFHQLMSAIDIIEGEYRNSVRVDKVWTGGKPLDMNDTFDRFMLGLLASHAESDYLGILQRTIAGRLVSADRGNWALGRTSVPWGYRFDERTRSLVVVESLQPKIEQMLRLMAGPGTKAAIARDIARLGMPMRRRRGDDDELVPLWTGARSGTLVFEDLVRMMPIYTHGEYLLRYSNPGLLVDELAGAPVVRMDDKDRGEFQMLLRAPLPPSGWATPDVLRAVTHRVVRESQQFRVRRDVTLRPIHPSVTSASVAPDLLEIVLPAGAVERVAVGRLGGAAAPRTSVLAGRRWQQEGHQYGLFSDTGDTYELRSRPAPKLRTAL